MNLANIPPRQKAPPFRSQKLKDFARGQDCTLLLPGICSRDAEKTVLCHIRLPGQSGTGQKPPDYLGIHACAECHRVEEAGEAGWDDVLLALAVTQARVFAHFKTLTP
jgi:hypothetical protein